MEQQARRFEVAGFLRAREVGARLGVDGPDRLVDVLEGGTLATELAPEAPLLHFRGQSDDRFGLSSSLHRFLAQESRQAVTEQVMLTVEAAMLRQMRDRFRLGRNLTDGQLLMILQHHGAPTRLVDVSLNPLEALYFACESRDGLDGRLFVVEVAEQPGGLGLLDLGRSRELPWIETAGRDEPTRGWTRQVSAVHSVPLDPRMGAQSSAFLVGGVLRNNQGLATELTAAQHVSVSTLSIAFPGRGERADGWNARGWSLRIPAAWKPTVMRRLAEHGITHEAMYPPFAEIAWKAELAIRSALRTS